MRQKQNENLVTSLKAKISAEAERYALDEWNNSFFPDSGEDDKQLFLTMVADDYRKYAHHGARLVLEELKMMGRLVANSCAEYLILGDVTDCQCPYCTHRREYDQLTKELSGEGT